MPEERDFWDSNVSNVKLGINMRRKIMKRLYSTLILVLVLCTNQLCLAYEPSMQDKIDAVNSYQPLQFAAQDPNVLNNRRELQNLRYESPIVDLAYIESMKLDNTYDSHSPIAKEKLVTNLTKKPFIDADTPISDPAEFDDIALEGNVLSERKRRPLFSRAKWEKWKPFLRGEPASDAILIGMQALHTDEHRNTRNNTNNMVALQYGGISAGRFVNSWYRETLFLTASRRIWKKDLGHDFSIDLQYKAGIMHGYENKAPIRLGWVEPIVLPLFGFNYKTSGADFWVIPSTYPVFAVNFRIGLPDPITYQSVHTRYEKKHPPKPKSAKPVIEDPYKQIEQEKI